MRAHWDEFALWAAGAVMFVSTLFSIGWLNGPYLSCADNSDNARYIGTVLVISALAVRAMRMFRRKAE